jgi:hydroxymethylpyrimidine/phosphomethylpyrimidine kinase
MLSKAEIIMLVAAKIKQYGIDKLIVDPVMIAKGGASLIRKEAVEVMKESLLPLAFIVTPNIPEAEVIAGMEINGIEDMKAAAERICRLGARNVVVKGGHLQGDAVDILYDGKRFREFRTKRIETKNTHGTGCTFSAALATLIGSGVPVLESVQEAKAYISRAIEHALEIGTGHGPTNHLAPLLFK